MSQHLLSPRKILKGPLSYVGLFFEWLGYSFLALLAPVCMGVAVIIAFLNPLDTEAFVDAFMGKNIGHMLVISAFLGGLVLYYRIKRTKGL